MNLSKQSGSGVVGDVCDSHIRLLISCRAVGSSLPVHCYSVWQLLNLV